MNANTIGTIPVGGIMVLFFAMLLSFWYWGVAVRYGNTLSQSANTRGANVSGANKTVNLKCDPGKVICVYRATQVCSSPGYTGKNFENPMTDPITNGLDGGGNYGEYSKHTTIPLTKTMGDECNGKNECSYIFKGDGFPFVCNGTSQLISSYTCVPEGGVCTPSPQ